MKRSLFLTGGHILHILAKTSRVFVDGLLIVVKKFFIYLLTRTLGHSVYLQINNAL
jgi:hypothetical protein